MPLAKCNKQEVSNIISNNNTLSYNDLIMNNINFANKIAHEYKGFGVPFEDLQQEAVIGLVEAAEKFERNKGIQFITYAVHYIRMRIRKVITFNNSKVYQPPSFTRKLFKIKQALSQDPNMSLLNISKTTKIPLKIVKKVLTNKISDVVSFNTPISSDDNLSTTLENVLNIHSTCMSQQESFDRSFILDNIESIMKKYLSKKEYIIMKLRYTNDYTLEKIGKNMGYSQAGIKIILERSINKLRAQLD